MLPYLDLEVLRSDRSEKALNSRNPRADRDTLFKIANSLLPSLPAILRDNPLPPDVSSPEVILFKYFQTIVDSNPPDQRRPAFNSFNPALPVEGTLMLVTALTSYHYWTSRSLDIPDGTLKLLFDSTTKFPDVTWVDGPNRG